jgi:hypothetical protein
MSGRGGVAGHDFDARDGGRGGHCVDLVAQHRSVEALLEHERGAQGHRASPGHG